MRNPRPFVVALTLAVLAPTVAAAALVETSPRLQAVIDSQRQLADERPGDPGVHNDLGNLLMLSGEAEAAREAYQRALTLEPEMASARYNLALLLHERGRPRAAARQLKKLLHHHPDHAVARYALGTIASERGRSERAVRHYAKAFYLRPELADPMVNPHAVKNRYRTRASLLAYSRRPASSFIERSYEDSARLATALVGVVEPRVEAPSEPAEGEAPDAGAEASDSPPEETGDEAPEPPPADGRPN